MAWLNARPSAISMTLILFSLVSIAVYLAAIYAAWRAANTARTPQGAVGWVVFLLAAPYVGVLTYLFLGHHRYRDYLVSRRASNQVVAAARQFAARYPVQTPPEHLPLRPFEDIAAVPATGGNDMALLIDGPETFDALFAAIDGAQSYILAQFYILRDDATGWAFTERLLAAAARGVHVRLLIDPVGSHSTPESMLDRLRQAGIEAPSKKALRRRAGRLQINYRNHRKSLVIDGQTGFTGGLNVGEEYMGRDPDFGDWRDTFVTLKGPVVAQLQLLFTEDWHWATGHSLIPVLHWAPEPAQADMDALILGTGPADTYESGTMLFLSCLQGAQERIWIASPYFVPDAEVLGGLKQAALRGIEVRILVPEIIDHRLPWLAARAMFDECQAAGVEFWLYTEGFMHQKAILVDNAMAAVGTMNLDNRSFHLNFEVMAAWFDPRAAAAVAQMLRRDFARARRLEVRLADQPILVRLGAPIARLFAPLL